MLNTQNKLNVIFWINSLLHRLYFNMLLLYAMFRKRFKRHARKINIH